jgi:hypothetical protein
VQALGDRAYRARLGCGHWAFSREGLEPFSATLFVTLRRLQIAPARQTTDIALAAHNVRAARLTTAAAHPAV